MKKSLKMLLPATGGLFTAILASTCCLSPLLSIAGFLGVTVSQLVWLSSAKPYLVTISLASIGYSLVKAYKKPSPDGMASCCTIPQDKNKDDRSFLQSKTFLWVMAIFTLITLIAPSIANAAPANPPKEEQYTYKVEKLTQSCCVGIIEYSLKKVKGYIKCSPDVKNHEITVWFDSTVTNKEDIRKAISKTGYTAEYKPLRVDAIN